MFILQMKIQQRGRLHGMLLSSETVEHKFTTLEELKVFVKKQEELKRIPGMQGKIFVDKKNGEAEEIGFLMKGRHKEDGETIYEEAWCEVFKTERILI